MLRQILATAAGFVVLCGCIAAAAISGVYAAAQIEEATAVRKPPRNQQEVEDGEG